MDLRLYKYLYLYAVSHIFFVVVVLLYNFLQLDRLVSPATRLPMMANGYVKSEIENEGKSVTQDKRIHKEDKYNYIN